MSIIAWIVIGGIAGWLASLVTGLGRSMGCLLNIVAGIGGGFLGGYLFTRLGHRGLTGWSWWSLLVAFVGAVIILLCVRLIALIFDR